MATPTRQAQYGALQHQHSDQVRFQTETRSEQPGSLGTVRTPPTTHWPKRSSRSANAAPIARGMTTSPLTAKRLIISARSRHRAGAESPATTASSGTRCPPPVLTGVAAATPTATTSHANATPVTSHWRSGIEYDHNNAGCDDLCKGELSSAGIAMRQAITQVVLDEFENAGPSYAPRSPSPDYDYVPGDNEGSD